MNKKLSEIIKLKDYRFTSEPTMVLIMPSIARRERNVLITLVILLAAGAALSSSIAVAIIVIFALLWLVLARSNGRLISAYLALALGLFALLFFYPGAASSEKAVVVPDGYSPAPEIVSAVGQPFAARQRPIATTKSPEGDSLLPAFVFTLLPLALVAAVPRRTESSLVGDPRLGGTRIVAGGLLLAALVIII